MPHDPSPPLNPVGGRLDKVGFWLFFWVISGILLLCSGAQLWLYAARRSALDVAQVEAQAQVMLLQSSVDATVRSIDMGLRVLAAELGECLMVRDQCATQARSSLRTLAPLFPEAQAFFVANGRGQIEHALLSSHEYRALTVDVSDRDYFRQLAVGYTEQLAVSTPQVGRVTGRMAINLARGLYGASGELRAVVLASLDVRRIGGELLLNRPDIGERFAIRSAGLVDVVSNGVGVDAQQDDAVRKHLLDQLAAGETRGTAWLMVGHEPVLVAHARLNNHPFVVDMQASEAAYLKPWLTLRNLVWGGMVVFSLAALGLTILWWTRYRTEALLRTQNLRLEREHLKELEKMAVILRHASDGFHIVDSQGVVVEANDQFCRMLGCTRGEVVGAHVTQWDRHLDPQTLQDTLLPALLASDEAQRIETLHQTRSGEVLNIDLQLNAFEMDGQRYLFASARDVTERNRMTALLVASEARFRQFFERNRSVMLLIAPESGQIVDANPSAAAYYGHSLEGLRGLKIGDINTLPPDELAAERALAAQEKRNYFQFRHRLASGVVRDVEVYSTPIQVDGEPQLFSIVHDVTERRQALEQLRLAANVFAYTDEGIVVTDANGTIVDVNDAFVRISGYTRAEAVGQTPRLLRSLRHPPEFYALMWAQINQTGRWRGEIWNRRKEGDIYAEMLTISAVTNAQGEVIQYVGIFSDITALKSHQATLEHRAQHDVLTDLPNRSLLEDRLERALIGSRRHGTRVAVVFMDLDGFKRVNDTHGHQVGDELLVVLARRLTAELRGGDTLARVGGDEFVAVLPDLTSPDAWGPIVQRMLAAASAPVPVESGQGTVTLNVSASIGVTLYPQDNADLDTLLQHADEAMYDAKQHGRNQWRLWTAGQDT